MQDAGSSHHLGCFGAQKFPFGRAGLSSLRLKGLTASSGPSSLQPRALMVLPQVCVARQNLLTEQQPPSISSPEQPNKQQQQPRLGIVAVVCDESLAPFLGLGCDAGGPEVLLHLYSKCGVTREQALEKLGHMAPCVATFREVEPTLETDLSWPKHHRDYLEHIIAKCAPSPLLSTPLYFPCCCPP